MHGVVNKGNKHMSYALGPARRIDLTDSRCSMTVQQVVAMRREVRETGVKNLRKFAERYQVSIAAISKALNGQSYQEANDFEPPVFLDRKTKKSQASIRLDRLKDIIQKHQENPALWNSTTLAAYLSRKEGKSYKPAHIVKMLRGIDAREAADQVEGKKYIYTKTCSWCDEEYKTIIPSSEFCSEKCRLDNHLYE